jgi:hypothetical protein
MKIKSKESHQIELSSVLQIFKTILASSFGQTVNKKLELEIQITQSGISGEYVVINNRTPVYRGEDINTAISIYNSL